MSFSLAGLQAIAAEQTDDGFFALITVTVPGITNPYRFVFNPVAVESRGETFLPAAMDIKLSDQVPDQPSMAQIQIAGVDRQMLSTLFTAPSGALVSIEYVLISNPEVVQRSNPNLELQEFQVTQGDQLKAQLRGPAFLRQAYPQPRMDRSVTPGIFRTGG